MEAEQDENDKPFQPESVGEPIDCYEWFECVVTEVIWQTGRTLFLTEQVRLALQVMLNQGATPCEAAKVLITKLKLARVD